VIHCAAVSTPPGAAPARARLAALALSCIALAGCGGSSEPALPIEPSGPFPVAVVVLESPSGETVDVPVWVANEPDARRRGLMFREELPAGTGMVFLFPGDSTSGFWMANTRIPLSIAYFAADGSIQTILDMEPCREDPCPSYPPEGPYRGALEVEQGFFDEVGVDGSWRVVVPEGDLPAPR
jgi:uncharacterized protein